MTDPLAEAREGIRVAPVVHKALRLDTSPVPSAQQKAPINIGAYIDDNTEDL